MFMRAMGSGCGELVVVVKDRRKVWKSNEMNAMKERNQKMDM